MSEWRTLVPCNHPDDTCIIFGQLQVATKQDSHEGNGISFLPGNNLYNSSQMSVNFSLLQFLGKIIFILDQMRLFREYWERCPRQHPGSFLCWKVKLLNQRDEQNIPGLRQLQHFQATGQLMCLKSICRLVLHKTSQKLRMSESLPWYDWLMINITDEGEDWIEFLCSQRYGEYKCRISCV